MVTFNIIMVTVRPQCIDNLFDVVMESEKSMAREGLTEDSRRLLSMPGNKSSRKIYSRYQILEKNILMT